MASRVGHHAKAAEGVGTQGIVFFEHDAEKYTFATLPPLRTLRDARNTREMRFRIGGQCASSHRSVQDN